MSQQKIFAAVCIISALIVVAASADVTPSGCIRSLQETAEKYGTKLQGVAMKFANSMSKSANFDMKGFTDEINQIVEGYMKLASPQTDLTPKAIYDSLTELMGKELGVFTKYIFNTGMSMGAVTAGSQALADILTLNTQTMSDVSTACLPGSA